MRVALRKALRNSVIVASRSDTLRDSTTNNEVFDDDTDLRQIREMAVCFHHAPDARRLVTGHGATCPACSIFRGVAVRPAPGACERAVYGCHCDVGRQPAFRSSLGLRGVHRHELALVQYPPGDGQPDFLCVRAPGRRTGVRRGQGEQPQGPRRLFDGTQVLDSLVHCADESQHRGQSRDHADQPECQ